MDRRYAEFAKVVDVLDELVFVLDEELRIIDYNVSVSKVTGFPDRRLRTKPLSDIIPPSHLAQFQKALRRQNHKPTDLKLLNAKGVELDVEIRVKKLRSGKKTYTVMTARDVTDERQKALDLLRFSNVIEHTINPIQITDAKGVMVYVNPAFELVTGYAKEELIGKNPNVLGSGKHDAEFWKRVWSHILSGRVWRGHLENRRKDGTPFFSDLVISPIVDDQGKVVGFLGAHRDITEQKVLEE